MDSRARDEIRRGMAEKADAYGRALDSLEAFYEDRIAALEQKIADLEERVGALEGAQYYVGGTGVAPSIEPIYESVEGAITKEIPEALYTPEPPATGSMGANEIILDLLRQGPMTSGELRDSTNMDLSVVTRGLRELRMEKKIRTRKDGSVIRYLV